MKKKIITHVKISKIGRRSKQDKRKIEKTYKKKDNYDQKLFTSIKLLQ